MKRTETVRRLDAEDLALLRGRVCDERDCEALATHCRQFPFRVGKQTGISFFYCCRAHVKVLEEAQP